MLYLCQFKISRTVPLSLLRVTLESQPRNDNEEFLELVIIFLGSVPERGIQFMAPGATHHARWVAKVIYSLKICMFREQFRLRKKEGVARCVYLCSTCLSKSVDDSSETS